MVFNSSDAPLTGQFDASKNEVFRAFAKTFFIGMLDKEAKQEMLLAATRAWNLSIEYRNIETAMQAEHDLGWMELVVLDMMDIKFKRFGNHSFRVEHSWIEHEDGSDHVFGLFKHEH